MRTISVEEKTVVIAVMVAAVLSAAGGGGSAAFFSDSVASEDNSISAGEWVEDVDLQVSPDPVEAGSEGEPVQVKIQQPSDGEIDPETVDVEFESESVADDPQTENQQWSIHSLDRQAVIDAVDGDPGEYTVTVSGELEDGGTFDGSTEVTVKNDSNDSSQTSEEENTTNETSEEENTTNETSEEENTTNETSEEENSNSDDQDADSETDSDGSENDTETDTNSGDDKADTEDDGNENG